MHLGGASSPEPRSSALSGERKVSSSRSAIRASSAGMAHARGRRNLARQTDGTPAGRPQGLRVHSPRGPAVFVVTLPIIAQQPGGTTTLLAKGEGPRVGSRRPRALIAPVQLALLRAGRGVRRTPGRSPSKT